MPYRVVTDGQTDMGVDATLACELIKNNIKKNSTLNLSQKFRNACHKIGQKWGNNVSGS